MAAESGDGHVDYPIVSPAKERVGNPVRQAHRRLHHLDAPGDIHRAAIRSAMHDEERLPLEVAVNVRLDAAGPHAAREMHLDPHAVRQGRGYYTAQDRAGAKRTPPCRTRCR